MKTMIALAGTPAETAISDPTSTCVQENSSPHSKRLQTRRPQQEMPNTRTSMPLRVDL